MQQTSVKNILHLPRWYPNTSDPQNGVFVLKQIKTLMPWYNNMVLFVKSEKEKKHFSVNRKKTEHYDELQINFAKSKYSVVNLYRYFKEFRKGMNILVKENGTPALIHIHILLRNGLLGWYYAWKFKIPFIVSEHWSGYITGKYEKKNFLYRKLMMMILHRAQKILVVSQSLKTALTTLGIDEEKLEIVPNVVEKSQVTTETGKKSGEKIIILSVADLVDDIKKISGIIEALAEIKNLNNIEYHIIGDGPDRMMLEKLSEQKNLLNKVVFFDGRKPNSEVLKIINNCSFLVINSITETFSVVTAEALMAGKPVVVTRCGGPEYFVNGTNGILIKPGNKKELKAALEKMIEEHKNYDPQRLKKSVEQKFSANIIGIRLKKIYDKILV